MTNLYDVLNVSRGATQEEIDFAYLARRRAHPDTASDARKELEAAYEVLGDPAKRSGYDAALVEADASAASSQAETAATVPSASEVDSTPEATPAMPEFVPPAAPRAGPAVLGDPVVVPGSVAVADDAPPAAVAPAPNGGGGKKLFLVLSGFIFILIALVAAGLGYILLSGDDGEDYPADLPDDQYDLASMGLQEADMPEGIVINQPIQDELAFGQVVGEGIEFSNADWAQILDQEDPETKERQLDALGRIRNHVRFFEAQPLRYGFPVQYSTQSTLFTDVPSAIESLRTDCDTVQDPTLTVTDLEIRTIGDQSTAFYVLTPTAEVGNIIETVVCFRTGRIVHSISQQGFEGTERLEVQLGLADEMLDNVEAAFDGDQG